MLTDFLKDYLSIVIFIFIALGLSIGFIVLNFLFSPKNPDAEKLSAYECGFEAFGDSRMEFDVRFYLVAILFIIFDLEIAFLFPWAISLGNIGALGFWSMMIFLFVLIATYQSQSSAPFFHSYTKPIVNTKRKIIIDQKPRAPMFPKDMAQGNRNAISKSKIINKIATR